MVPLVLVHVAVIFYASRKGMSAADILGRTRGSMVWASFYGVVRRRPSHSCRDRRAQCAGRMVAARRPAQRLVAIVFGILLLVLGLRAVAAVVLP